MSLRLSNVFWNYFKFKFYNKNLIQEWTSIQTLRKNNPLLIQKAIKILWRMKNKSWVATTANWVMMMTWLNKLWTSIPKKGLCPRGKITLQMKMKKMILVKHKTKWMTFPLIRKESKRVKKEINKKMKKRNRIRKRRKNIRKKKKRVRKKTMRWEKWNQSLTRSWLTSWKITKRNSNTCFRTRKLPRNSRETLMNSRIRI